MSTLCICIYYKSTERKPIPAGTWRHTTSYQRRCDVMTSWRLIEVDTTLILAHVLARIYRLHQWSMAYTMSMYIIYTFIKPLSRENWFQTMWYMRPAKPQISLSIHAVWSEPFLVAWIFYDCYAIDWTYFGVSKLKKRLYRLVWVYLCQHATLLEISCRGSLYLVFHGILV